MKTKVRRVRLDRTWDRLSKVDQMILESYYWEGCRMDEIANRVGYKTADSVKSRKNKVLRRMMVLMSKDREGSSDDELPSSFVIPEAA